MKKLKIHVDHKLNENYLTDGGVKVASISKVKIGDSVYRVIKKNQRICCKALDDVITYRDSEQYYIEVQIGNDLHPINLKQIDERGQDIYLIDFTVKD